MGKTEKKIVNYCINNRDAILIIAITLISILIRYKCLIFVSPDASAFLLPWFETISNNGGLAALKEQVGNYNIAYQTVIAALTYIDFASPLLRYKGVSIFFDYVLAVEMALFTYDLCKDKHKSKIVYVITVLSPLVFINSAFWAQCDSIYTAFVVMALRHLWRGNSKDIIYSFVFLGIAFGFKFQTCFILPFYVYYYVSEKKFPIWYFLIALFSFYLCNIPGLIAGRNWYEPFTIYFQQTQGYWLAASYPSVWTFFSTWDIFMLKAPASLFAFGVLGMACYCLIDKKVEVTDADSFLKVAIWLTWTAVLCLPRMLERYGFIFDVLFIVLAVLDTQFFPLFIIENFVILGAYGNALFVEKNISIEALSLCMLVVWIWYTVKGVFVTKNNEKMDSFR